MRLAFIGAGGNNNGHMSRTSGLEGVEIVAICDVVEEKAKETAAKYGARAYTDYHELYDKEEVEAVFISIPPFAHEEQELMALERGIPFFVEKPMTTSMDLARKVSEGVQQTGLVSAVGFQDRYLDIADKMKELLQGEQVGVILGYWMGGMPGVMWWRQKAQSGGQAAEQTIHTFDQARNLFGEVESVYALGRRGIIQGVEKYDIEDASAVSLSFKSGLIGTIYSGCYQKVRHRVGLEILGENLYIEYAGRSSLLVQRAGCEPKTIQNSNDASLECDQVFLQAVAKGDPTLVRSPYPDAAKSLEIVLAANESMETGQPVKLTLA